MFQRSVNVWSWAQKTNYYITVKRKLYALRPETRCSANNGYRWFFWALLQITEILFQNRGIKNVVDERKI